MRSGESVAAAVFVRIFPDSDFGLGVAQFRVVLSEKLDIDRVLSRYVARQIDRQLSLGDGIPGRAFRIIIERNGGACVDAQLVLVGRRVHFVHRLAVEYLCRNRVVRGFDRIVRLVAGELYDPVGSVPVRAQVAGRLRRGHSAHRDGPLVRARQADYIAGGGHAYRGASVDYSVFRFAGELDVPAGVRSA